VARSVVPNDFSRKAQSFQTNNPTDPLPANQVASDFASHKTSIDASIDFAKLVQRSDGRLNNGSVRPETLSAGTVALIGKWTPRGDWLTTTAYAVNDLVTESNNLYVCLSPIRRASSLPTWPPATGS
jgi:hypothetical protein